MRTKLIVWVVPILLVGAALLRSVIAADREPEYVAQVPSLFSEPGQVGRELSGPEAPDAENYQPRSRLVRSMYELVEGMRDGSVEGQAIDDEQRRFIRSELMRVDDELADSMGPNLRRTMLRANNPRRTFSVKAEPQNVFLPRRDTIEELHRLRVEEPNHPALRRPVVPAPAAPVTPAPAVPPPVADPFAN